MSDLQFFDESTSDKGTGAFLIKKGLGCHQLARVSQSNLYRQNREEKFTHVGNVGIAIANLDFSNWLSIIKFSL